MSDYSEDSKPPPKRRITLNDVVEFVGQNDPTFHTGILEVSAQVTKHINVFNETITQNARIFEQLAKPAWLDAAESLQQRINQTIEQIARPAWMDIVQSFQKSIEQQRIDFAKIFEVDISFTRSQSAELIAQRFTSPSAATDRVIAAHRKTAQIALKIAIGAIPSNPRKQKTIALPPQDTPLFMKLAYDEIVEFIGDEDMKNQFVAKIGHFDIDLNFWGNNKIKLYVKNRLIAYLAVNYIKKTSQMHFYEPTNAEDATAYLEGFQVIHRLQIHLYSTIGTAPPPARDHNLLWTPEPLPPTLPQPQPTQPEPVKVKKRKGGGRHKDLINAWAWHQIHTHKVSRSRVKSEWEKLKPDLSDPDSTFQNAVEAKQQYPPEDELRKDPRYPVNSRKQSGNN